MIEQIAIKVEGLHKYYGKVHALRGVSIKVRQGEMYGFLGPNGARKTTTIRCMLDLIRPQVGSIEILGMDPQKQPVEVRSRIGYLPGELNLETNIKCWMRCAILSTFEGIRSVGIILGNWLSAWNWILICRYKIFPREINKN